MRKMSNRRAAVTLAMFCMFYMVSTSFSNYQTVYLQNNGFTASQIGLVNALSSVTMIFAQLFLGILSDKLHSVKKVLLPIMVGGMLCYLLLPAIPVTLKAYFIIMTVFLPFASMLRNPTYTFIDNLLVRDCAEMGIQFGRIRSLGAAALGIGSFISAAANIFMGIEWCFYLSVIFEIPCVLLIFFIPEPGAAAHKEKPDFKELFRCKPFIIFLVFMLFFYFSESCENNFLAVFMDKSGIGAGSIGVVVGVRSVLQFLPLFLIPILRKKIPLTWLLRIGALLLAADCFLVGNFASDLQQLIIVQVFYSFGEGIIIGCATNYCYEITPNNVKATAQSVLVIVSCISGTLGNLIGGVMIDTAGTGVFYTVAALVSLFAAVIFLMAERKHKTA